MVGSEGAGGAAFQPQSGRGKMAGQRRFPECRTPRAAVSWSRHGPAGPAATLTARSELGGVLCPCHLPGFLSPLLFAYALPMFIYLNKKWNYMWFYLDRSTFKLPEENPVYFFLRKFIVSFFPLGISVGWLAVRGFSHCVERVLVRQ